MVYHKIFLFPAAAILCMVFLSGFTSPKEEVLVRDLLLDRTQILEEFYYGHASLQASEERLAEVETQPLLKEDIAAMRAWEATDLDMVKGLTVLSLEKRTGLYGYLAFDAVILWNMQGLAGSYTEITEYNVVLKQSGKQYRISIFEAI